ncbi:MAG TPA: phytoene/squalene synthase family protein [Bryobacteraceae bacterium]|nr:phytoene/squalene synthase family protein [Bryobacteraceae bacterium]
MSADSHLKESYAWCEKVARSQAKNFYYSFLLLSAEKRRAMCAIYAFMRYCDDLSDDEGVADRPAAIAQWRRDLTSALSGNAPPDYPLWPAFADTVHRFRIPHQYFFDMIDGVSSDLEPRRIRTFEELYDYCYHVASVVGLTIVHIFGFEEPQALELAEKCGVAFQITNILRDVREDAEKHRVYLPVEDLERFQVSAETFGPHDRFRELMAFEAERARDYFRQAAPLLGMVDAGSRASLKALIAIYSRLLDRIVDSNFDVLARRIRVSTAEKIWLLVRSVGDGAVLLSAIAIVLLAVLIWLRA